MTIIRNLVFLLFAISLTFAIDVTACTNISLSGTYVLTQTISGVNASALPAAVPACIFINSSDVVFSCGETTRFNVSADAVIPSSRGIFVINTSNTALSNVTVINCTSGHLDSGIRGYDFGFDTSYSAVTFRDSNVYNTTYGVQVDTNSANRIEFVNLTIINSTSLSSTTGLFVSASSNVLIENSSFLNLRSPITFSNSNAINFTNNFVNNTLDPGLSGAIVAAAAYDILIGSNNISYTNSSAVPAIRFSSAENSTVSGNRLLYDQGSGSSYGIEMASSNNNNITNNYLSNYTYGIILGNGNQNNTVSGNTILNMTYGVRFGTAQISNITSNNISNSNFSVAFITSASSSSSGLVTINSNNFTHGDSGVYLFSNVYNTTSAYIINVSNNFAHNFTNGYYVRMTNASIYLNNNTANSTSNSGFYYGRSYANSSYNRATNSLGDGFLLNGSTFYSYFTSNNATNPARNGFSILGSVNTSVSGGVISGSTLDGIFVNQSSNTTFNQTVVSGSFLNGAHLLNSSSSSTFDSVRFYNNSLDFRVNHSGAGASSTLLLSNTIFDLPQGPSQNYTNLSLSDSLSVGDEYTLNWSALPASLPNETFTFQNTYLNITNLSSVSIDSLNMSWLESDLGPYSESLFMLYKYNSSGWFSLSDSPNTSSNIIGASSLSSFSVFAILQNNSTISSTPSPEPGGSSSAPLSSRYDFDASFTCSDGLRLSLENNRGVRIDSSFVVFDFDFNEITTGRSDSSGYYYFNDATAHCGESLRLRARFSSGALDRSFRVDCSACSAPPECTVDSDCASSHMCSSFHCVARPPECTVDSDCSSTQVCSSLRCVDISCPVGTIVNRTCVPPIRNETTLLPPECTSDSSCSSSSYCGRSDSGNLVCLPILTSGRCGEVLNHQFVSYQCGSDPSCPSCASNYTCVSNRCVTYRLNAPAQGVVGSSVDVVALLGSDPVPGSSIRVTTPDGRTSTLQTDSSGRIRQLFGSAGSYRFDLVQDGNIIRSVTISSVPKRGSGSDDLLAIISGTAATVFPWLLLVILIGFGIYYYYTRIRKS